jgi:hypothetical protein
MEIHSSCRWCEGSKKGRVIRPAFNSSQLSYGCFLVSLIPYILPGPQPIEVAILLQE